MADVRTVFGWSNTQISGTHRPHQRLRLLISHDLHMDMTAVLQSPDKGDHLPFGPIHVLDPPLPDIELRILAGDALEAIDRLGADRWLAHRLHQIVERGLTAPIAEFAAAAQQLDRRQLGLRLQQRRDLMAERLGTTRTTRAGTDRIAVQRGQVRLWLGQNASNRLDRDRFVRLRLGDGRRDGGVAAATANWW